MSLNLADPTPFSLGSLHLQPSDEIDANSEKITSHQNFQDQSLTSLPLQRAKNKASMITPKTTETTINNISVNEIEDTSTISYSSSLTPTNFLKNGDKFTFRSRSFKRLLNKRQSFSRQTEEPEPFEEVDSPNLLLKGVKERLKDKILKSSSSYFNLEDDPSPENKSSLFSVIEQMSPDFGNGPKMINLISSETPVEKNNHHRNQQQYVNFQSIEENSIEQGKMTESPRLSERHRSPQNTNIVSNEAIPTHGENNNEIANNDLEAQQQNPLRPQDEPREVLPEIESKLYLKRCISTFLAGSAVSACLLLAIEQDMYQKAFIQGAFGVIYLYLLYRMAENKKRYGLIDRESWRRKEDILDVADVFVKILFVMSIHLKVLDLLSFSRASFLIICATGVIYYFKSEAPAKIRSMRLYVKLLYALQALLLTLKLHGDIEWSWIYVFSVSWLFFGFVGVYLVAYAAVFILSCLFLVIQVLFRRTRNPNAHLKIQTQGILWSSLYYGLGASTFLALLGFNQFDSLNGGADLFKKALLFSLGLNGFLFLYTTIAFQNLTKYIQYYSLTDDSLLGADGEDNVEQTEAETKMQVFKRNHYFVMLSSTYFKPLSKTLMEKNEERLKEIKAMISSFKKQKKRNSRGQENPISVEELKQNKESLDKKFNDVLAKGKLVPSALKLGLKLDGLEYEMRQSQLSLSRTRSNSMGKKGHLSLDDCHDLKEWNLKKFEVCQEVQEDNSCYLCCSKAANALLMGCGHGGICYDCAIEIVQKNNQCMQCRQAIDEVCKIDPSCQVTPTGFIKTIEVCKISRGV